MDKPSVSASMVDCEGRTALIVADKNHGGGRRLRLVPAHEKLKNLK